MAKMHMAYNKIGGGVNGYKMKKADIFALYDCYKDDRKLFMDELVKEAPERIHTFVPGLLIYTRIMKIAAVEYVTVSSFGVREGYLINKVMY
jgi:exopolyphosphatase/guanosine-5'-triphosphate,3'-diphosphate pyrophosphatase